MAPRQSIRNPSFCIAGGSSRRSMAFELSVSKLLKAATSCCMVSFGGAASQLAISSASFWNSSLESDDEYL